MIVDVERTKIELTGKPEQQRFTIRSGVVTGTSSRRRGAISVTVIVVFEVELTKIELTVNVANWQALALGGVAQLA